MQLTPHPSESAPAGLCLDAERAAGPPGDADALRLCYVLRGERAALRLPAAGAPERRDGLWRHSCFELFVGAASGEGYLEFNFSPSTAWAAYAFDGYRQGMRPLQLERVPQVRCAMTQDTLTLDVLLPRVELAAALGARAGARCAMGLTAVLEAASGPTTHWALAHPAARPDFHHRGGFVATLEL